MKLSVTVAELFSITTRPYFSFISQGVGLLLLLLLLLVGE